MCGVSCLLVWLLGLRIGCLVLVIVARFVGLPFGWCLRFVVVCGWGCGLVVVVGLFAGDLWV